MQSSCYVCGFTAKNKDAEGLSFHWASKKLHRRPIVDKWLEFLFLPPTNQWPDKQWHGIRLCSIHFKDRDFCGRQVCFRRVLRDDAVPTQCPPIGPGRFGAIFPRRETNSDNSITGPSPMEESETPVAEGELAPLTERVVEEEASSTHFEVSTPLNLPDVASRGVSSKFHLKHNCSLKRMMNLPIRKELTPRRDRMYKVATFYRQKYLRLSRKCLDMNPPMVQPGQEINQDNSLAGKFLRSHYQNSKKLIQARRYSKIIKAACLALQGRSRKAYKLLGEMFALPGPRTLNRTCQSIPLTTGISKAVLRSIKARLPTMSEIDRICVLMFDEMSLSKHLDYDPIQDHIFGYQDVDGNRCPIFADHALVFMVRGLISEWKQPVAFHLGQAISKGNLENAIKNTVLALQDIGLKIVAIVSDMAQSNVSALQSLATKTLPEKQNDPMVQIGNQKIFVFADSSHLLKVLRNNFLKYDVEFIGRDGERKVAKFQVLEEFCKYDREQLVPEVYLSDRHLYPNSKEKMNVKLAAQLFSRTVSLVVINFSLESGNSDAKHLAEFIGIINNLFDSFNCSTIDGKPLHRIVQDGSFHHQFWNLMLRHLVDWKFVVRTPGSGQPQSKCFYFWRRNIIAIQGLWKEVRGLGVKCLKTRNINQDPLECFFGCVRQQGVCNTNPSPKLFVEIFKILCLNSVSLNLTSKRGNVLESNIAALADLLNSTSEDNNSLDTVARVGQASTSLASQCSVNKEVKACTQWVVESTCSTSSERAFGSAQDIPVSFLKKNNLFVSSCFVCYHDVYHCPHPMHPSGKVVCKKTSTPNFSFGCEISKLYDFILNELVKKGHESHLTKKLKESVRGLPLHSLSCSEHRDEFHDRIKNVVIRIAVKKFCSKVNNCISALARKTKPHK